MVFFLCMVLSLKIVVLEMQMRNKLGTLRLEIALTGNYKYFHQKEVHAKYLKSCA